MPIFVVPSHDRWRAQCAQFWQASSDVSDLIAIDTPTEQSLYPYLLKEYRRQPQLGFVASSDQDVSPGNAWASVRQWQRWQPQPALGWFTAGDQPQFDADTPTPVSLRPYLFAGFRCQPWLGWADRADHPPPVIPAPWPIRRLPLHPYLFTSYLRQPQLGRSWAWDSSAAPPVPPAVVRRTGSGALVVLLLRHYHRGFR